MANDLTITIDVEAAAAKAELRAVDQGLNNLKSTANDTGSALSKYEQQVQKVVTSKQDLTKATEQATGWYQSLSDAVAGGHEVYNQAITDQQQLFDWVNRGGQGWQGYAQTARDAWDALKSIRFSDIRDGLNSLAESAGLTFQNLGLMGSAGAVMGAGVAGWKIGTAIDQFVHLDTMINKVMDSLARGQAAGAAQDAINLAIARGATNVNTLTEALKFNTQWVQNQSEAFQAMDDIAARARAPFEFARQIRDWHVEIQKVTDSGGLPALEAALKSGAISVRELSDSYRISVGAINLHRRELADDTEAIKKEEAEHKRLQEEAQRTAEHLAKLTETNRRWTANMEAEASLVERYTHNLRGLGVELQKINDLQAKRISMQGELMPDMGTGGFGMPGDVAGTGDTGRGFFGNLLGKIGGQLDPKTIFSSMIGGGLSGLISTGVGLVGKGITSLFGAVFHTEEKEVNKTRQAFVDAAGGIAALNEKAHDAGLTLDRMLRAKTVTDYQAAIKELNDTINFQTKAMQTLDATVEKYGFTIDQLGPKFRQQKLDEQAASLVQDYQVLIAAGIENVTVLEKMAPAMNEYIHTIMTAGGTIPTQLQAPLQKLLDMGQLTDLAGEKMTDLSQLTFAETLDQKFTTLIDTINKLADAISKNLGTAINNLPTEHTVHVGFQVDASPDFGGPERMHSGGVVLPFVRAHRGLAVDEVPIIAQRGEGILNRRAMRRLGGGAGLNQLNAGVGGGGLGINVSIDQISTALDPKTAGDQIGRAVVNEMRRKGVRFSNR